MKTRGTRIMIPLVECKVVTDLNLYTTRSLFPPVFTETAPEVERNKKNKLKNSLIYSQKNIFKVLTDIT